MQDLGVLLVGSLLLRFQAGVELNLGLELVVRILILPREMQADTLDFGAVAEHVGESFTTFSRPQLLVILRLLDRDRFKRSIAGKKLRDGFQSRVGKNSNVQPLDVCVAIDCLNHPRQANIFQTDTRESNADDWVASVVANGMAEVLTCAASETVTVEL